MGLLERFTKPNNTETTEKEQEIEEEFDEEEEILENDEEVITPKVKNEETTNQKQTEDKISFKEAIYELVNESDEDPRVIYYELGALSNQLLLSLEQDEE